MTDQMRVTSTNDYLNDRPGEEIRVGDIVNVRPYENGNLKFEFENPSNPGQWLCAYERELEAIEEEETVNEVVVGTRVRCINTSSFNGREGEVIGVSDAWGEPTYHIAWDGNLSQLRHENGGFWSRGAFEVIGDEDEDEQIEALIDFYEDILKQKDAALTVAAFVFSQYAENHLAKGTGESTLKALTNLGLEAVMLDALEAD